VNDAGDFRNCCSGVSVGNGCCIPNGSNAEGDTGDCCSAASVNNVCSCRENGLPDNAHAVNCCSAFSNGTTCIAPPANPPPVCTEGAAGVVQGVPWVVCRADAASAWLSTAVSFAATSIFDPVAACLALGYGDVGEWGTTGGERVCGIASDPGTTCAAPGTESYNQGAYDPDEDNACGGLGLLCGNVIWSCLA
jgi:hypothetical protein